MSLDDRDYYKQWWRKKTGYVERAKFRLPANPPRRPDRSWHPVLIAIVWVAVLLMLYAIFKATL